MLKIKRWLCCMEKKKKDCGCGSMKREKEECGNYGRLKIIVFWNIENSYVSLWKRVCVVLP
jgi:hypothetical protein